MNSKLLQTTILTLASLILVVLLGCSTVLDAITPCYIPPELGKFVNEPMTTFVPYTTVFDAERMLRKTQYLLGGLQIGMEGAREFQRNVFDPTGPLALLFVGGPALAIGALGISKPKDKQKIMELQNGKS